MTALVAMSPSDRVLGPVGWRRLSRAALERHRGVALVAVVVFVGLLVGLLVANGVIHPAYARYLAAGCVVSPFHVPCGTIEDTFSDGTDPLSVLLVACHVVPVLLGAFVGAPLVARELESGVFAFTWTQAAGRRRELLVTLSCFALPVIAAAAVLGLVAGSYVHAFEVAGNDSRWTAAIFEASPVVFPAWCLFGLAIGVLLGAAIGRVVAAVAASAAILGAASLFSFQFLHRLLAIAPATRSVAGVSFGIGALNEAAPKGRSMSGSWLVSSWLTGAGGKRLSPSATARVWSALSRAKLDTGAWLAKHHVTSMVSYQPAGRYWIFQATECALLLALSALAVAATVTVVARRRA